MFHALEKTQECILTCSEYLIYLLGSHNCQLLVVFLTLLNWFIGAMSFWVVRVMTKIFDRPKFKIVIFLLCFVSLFECAFVFVRYFGNYNIDNLLLHSFFSFLAHLAMLNCIMQQSKLFIQSL